MPESETPPPSRRQLRDRSRDDDAQARRKRGRVRAWVWASVAVILVAGVAVSIWAAQRIVGQAQEARTHLTAAMPHAEDLQAALLASDPEAAAAAARAFSEDAAQAEKATSGRLWGFASSLPLPVTENLRAVRIVTQVASALGSDVLTPASALDLNSLKPAQGRVDVAALQSLSAQVADMAASIRSSLTSIEAIDRGALIDQVDAGVADVGATLERLDGVLEPAESIISVLPDALGAEGPRNYLLMFQGNAEARAAGGGPGSFILVHVENGALTIANEAAATEFDIALPKPVMPLDPETEAVYSDTIGRWIANLTATPDFPTSAALAKAWWAQRSDEKIDGVISVDPVALSYMLVATGPLQLPTGESLTSDNAVSLLLNGAYFAYPTGVESNLFFAGASASIFAAMTQGAADPVAFVNAITRSADEGRIKVWTADPEEQALLGASPASGILPVENTNETTVGVFFNDTTGAKMDYYVDAAVSVASDQCTASAEPSWTTTVAFENTITRDDARALPGYITGPYYTPGDIATDFVVYAPVGAKIESWTLNGKEYAATTHTTHLGRDVVRLAVVTPPTSTSTLVVSMSGAPGVDADAYGPLSVRNSPMVRDTPVTIDAPGCE
ncbi:DUF4012 domain-containing protein [Microbacterium sp. PMB16]|uniref:DUF4012 domain-containing protein n=1 Tax=Microbacterium sp. PMB16 TaxID=3120157 RepID=UPI003F4BF84E